MTLALLIEINPVVMMLIKYFNITLTTLLLILYLLPKVIIDLCQESDNYYQYPLPVYSHAERKDF